jgi:hypothetical protein
MIEVMTGCYGAAKPLLADPDTAVVRISLGKPRWYPFGGADLPYLSALAPAPWYFREPDQEVWERRYRHQMHKTTPKRVLALLTETAEQAGASRLVLCCFEANPLDCHRSMFSRWWLEQTGEEVFDLADIGAMGVAA